MKKSAIILIITAFVIVGGILGYFMWPKGADNLPAGNDGNNSSDTSEIDTSNWKTYRNEKYGFTIKYPLDWAVGSEFTAPADLPYVDNLIIQQKDDHLGDTVMLVNIFVKNNKINGSSIEYLNFRFGGDAYIIMENFGENVIAQTIHNPYEIALLDGGDYYISLETGQESFSDIQKTIIKNIEIK